MQFMMGINTARRFRIFVGWVEALRNPTNPAKCWVSFLNPTYTFLFFRQNLRSIVTGMGNIRDVIPFPRTPQSAEF
ncbi:hypothetical protein [Nostoc sp.]|uniref:hypothetical protein n=1 Tax=Nostoc sp. TaxID=1180 RepID=UPI002FFC6117